MYARKVSTVGNTVLDLENFGALPEIPYEGVPYPYPRREGPGEKKREEAGRRQGVKTKVKKDDRQRIVLLSIVGYLCAGFMLALVLMSYIQLTMATDEAVALEAEVETLKEDSAQLSAQYENAFNLVEVEEYAKRQLGMIEPTSVQIYYIDIAESDEAVVLSDSGKAEENFFDRAVGFLNAFVEYFK